MIFGTTALYEDVHLWFRNNGKRPSEKEILKAIDRLKVTSAEGKSVLMELDRLIRPKPKRYYNNENVTRIMREKGLNKKEAQKVYAARKRARVASRNRKKDRIGRRKYRPLKPALLANEHGYYVVAENIENHFPTRKEAYKFLVIEYSYALETARVLFARNLKEVHVNIKGWFASYIPKD